MIDPGRDLGHVDGKKKSITPAVEENQAKEGSPACTLKEDSKICEDCGWWKV